MMLYSAGTIIQNWLVILVKLPILLPISLGAQLRNRHRTVHFVISNMDTGHGTLSALENPILSDP
jgi:hypothetical protein